MKINRSSKSAQMAIMAAQIERLSAELAEAQRALSTKSSVYDAVIAQRNELLIIVSSAALEKITSAAPSAIYEREIESASAAIFASIDEDLEEISTMIDEELSIKVVRLNGVSFICMMDDLRVIFASVDHAVACKIASGIVESAYDQEGEMEGEGSEKIYRALSSASMQEEVEIWALTARDCGDLD